MNQVKKINDTITFVGFLILNYDSTYWSKSRALAMNVAKMRGILSPTEESCSYNSRLILL